MANLKLTQLTELVLSLTSRPDLVKQTEVAIKTATMQAHLSDEYYKDKVIVDISPAATQEGAYSVDISSVPFVRFRKVLQLLDVPHMREFAIVEATDLFSEQFSNRVNVCYQAGMALNIIGSGVGNLRCVYISNPDLTTEGYSSWIAEEREDLIAYGATAIIQDLTGRREESVANKRLFLQAIRELQATYIT